MCLEDILLDDVGGRVDGEVGSGDGVGDDGVCFDD